MAEQIITLREPEAAPEGRVSIGELLKYEEIITSVVGLWKSVSTLAVGAVVKLATIKVHFAGGEYSWNMGEIVKTK